MNKLEEKMKKLDENIEKLEKKSINVVSGGNLAKVQYEKDITDELETQRPSLIDINLMPSDKLKNMNPKVAGGAGTFANFSRAVWRASI